MKRNLQSAGLQILPDGAHATKARCRTVESMLRSFLAKRSRNSPLRFYRDFPTISRKIRPLLRAVFHCRLLLRLGVGVNYMPGRCAKFVEISISASGEYQRNSV